jgi:histidine triad (HIT) family protein
MSDTCLFCKIISNEIPGDIVHQDDQVTAFRDIQPVAPTHILIVPNNHIGSLNAIDESHEQLMGHLITTAGKLAKEEEIDEGGYRLIMNTNADGGQTMFHIHLHLIGGQKMKHPMG